MLRVCSLALFLWMSTSALAADYPTPKSEATSRGSLIQENDSLAILQERSLQKSEERSRNIFGLSYQPMRAERLVMFANERAVTYNAADGLPGAGITYAFLPIQWYGLWGIEGAGHYTYLENRSRYITSLHWASFEAAFMYRYETNRMSWVKPFATLGTGTNIMFQRGVTDFRTSEARGTGVASLGAALNLTRTFQMDTPLLWEASVRYKRLFGPSSSRMDFNNGLWSFGMELAL